MGFDLELDFSDQVKNGTANITSFPYVAGGKGVNGFPTAQYTLLLRTWIFHDIVTYTDL